MERKGKEKARFVFICSKFDLNLSLFSVPPIYYKIIINRGAENKENNKSNLEQIQNKKIKIK